MTAPEAAFLPVAHGAPFRVTSAIPGRVRVQLTGPARRDGHGRLEPLAARLGEVAAVLKTDVVADANSVVVRYEASRRELESVVRDIEVVAADVLAAAEAPNPNPSAPLSPPRTPPEPASIAPTKVSVVHGFPGRLRLRVPRLRGEDGTEAASGLKVELGREPGVHSVEVTPGQGFVIVRYDADVHLPAGIVRLVERLLAALAAAPGGGAVPDDVARARDIPAESKPHGLKPLVFPTVAVALALAGPAAVPALVLRGALAVAALPLARRALEGARARRFNVDQLDLTALVVLGARGDYLIGGIMTWLIGLGDIIRAKTMGRARREVASLMSPAKQQAWVERAEGPVSVPVSRLLPGDTVLVYPGDQIPADGVIIRGRALVDQKVLTGESAPLVREAGDAVYALTLVAEGQLALRVEHIGKETRAGQVVAMIEDAPLSDTRIQNYAAKIGDRLVGPIFGLALATYLLGGDSLRVAGVLILDFASGIRVSAPVTILSAMTGAAKRGLFIKGGKAIENLAQVNAVVFDKTGTLTRGEPVITGAHALDSAFTEGDVLRLAASAEANLKHPAAKAIVDAATQRGLDLAPSTQMDYALGLGLRAVVKEHTVQVGSERYLRQSGVDVAPAAALAGESHAAGRSLVYVAVDDRLIGLLAYADPPRPESAQVVRALQDRGIKRIVLLTGDNARAAQAVAAEVGIAEVMAEAFPEQKAEVVQRLRAEGFTVAVIGDGINDSPAFMRADVGVSLPHGADVAREVADVILLDGDLGSLPRALDLSRDAMGVLRQNVNIVVWPTALGIAASLVGRATPLLSTLISHGTTIVAGLNGLRPLFPQEPAPATPGPRRLMGATRQKGTTGRADPAGARRSRQAAPPASPPPLQSQEGDLRALVWPMVRRLPAYLRLAWALSREPAIPWRHKTLLYLFPVYYVSPAHLAVHPIPVLGQIDGVFFLVLALRQALAHCPRPVLARHLARLNLAPTQLEDDWRTALYVVRRVGESLPGLGGLMALPRPLRPARPVAGGAAA